MTKKTNFRIGNSVKVISGFYKGEIGEITLKVVKRQARNGKRWVHVVIGCHKTGVFNL